jgi:hypothetical protein
VGNITLRLPADTGVRITAKNELGKITADGLQASGNVYTNDAYSKTSTTLNIEVSNDVGEINLLTR